MGITLLSMGFALFVLELTHSELGAEFCVTTLFHLAAALLRRSTRPGRVKIRVANRTSDPLYMVPLSNPPTVLQILNNR